MPKCRPDQLLRRQHRQHQTVFFVDGTAYLARRRLSTIQTDDVFLSRTRCPHRGQIQNRKPWGNFVECLVKMPESAHWSLTLTRILIIGAGPTGLGATDRLRQLGLTDDDGVHIRVIEADDRAGGLAASYRDKAGFLWDLGGHVTFSHHARYRKMLDRVLDGGENDWNDCQRAAFVLHRQRLVPYPLQQNLAALHDDDFICCLEGWRERPTQLTIRSFDDWIVREFGTGIADLFMRPYNRKVWATSPTEMNSNWIAERIAGLSREQVDQQLARRTQNTVEMRDSHWGPNQRFRYPRRGGNGAVWTALSKQLPDQWMSWGTTLVALNLDQRCAQLVGPDGSQTKTGYDVLINTSPLDVLAGRITTGPATSRAAIDRARHLRRATTHVIGIGLRGQPPPVLSDKSWIYFPSSEQPFHRITVLSSYSDDMVPEPGSTWSLLCETSDHPTTPRPQEKLLAATIAALSRLGWIDPRRVVSRWYRRLPHGYPVPCLARDAILAEIHPHLETHGVYSRGRFGGWCYEIANQDHGYLQGVEVVDRIVSNARENVWATASWHTLNQVESRRA